MNSWKPRMSYLKYKTSLRVRLLPWNHDPCLAHLDPENLVPARSFDMASGNHVEEKDLRTRSYDDRISYTFTHNCWSQWPRGLSRWSAAARLLRLWIRIPPGAWMSVCGEFCVLSGRGLCDELITRPEECYRLWCVVMCDRETS